MRCVFGVALASLARDVIISLWTVCDCILALISSRVTVLWRLCNGLGLKGQPRVHLISGTRRHTKDLALLYKHRTLEGRRKDVPQRQKDNVNQRIYVQRYRLNETRP